jgi:hypothetical protein
MKLYTEEIFRRNLQFVLFLALAALSGVAITLNIIAIAKARRTALISIDTNGTRLVTEKSDPIFKTEAVLFIQRFTFNIYNFDNETFLKRVGLATAMMSEELWHKKKSEILSLKQKVDTDSLSLKGEVERITLDDQGVYHGLISILEHSRLSSRDHKIEFTAKLKSITRTADNPQGLEVDFYEENIIRN